MQREFDLSELPETATYFWSVIGSRKIIAFHGQMGAGKTTFIKALCDAKKVTSAVASPTFSIINEYAFPEGRLFHIDLYRLNSEEEAIRAGVEECLHSNNICLVEWPEKAPAIFPDDTVAVYLTVKDTTRRTLQIGNK